MCLQYSELENLLGDEDRARAVLELAVGQPVLDMPEVCIIFLLPNDLQHWCANAWCFVFYFICFIVIFFNFYFMLIFIFSYYYCRDQPDQSGL